MKSANSFYLLNLGQTTARHSKIPLDRVFAVFGAVFGADEFNTVQSNIVSMAWG
jgi:hypothetical protein